MPQWAWLSLLLGLVVVLFVFTFRVAGGEPLDREDAGGGDEGFRGSGRGHGDHGHGNGDGD